MNYEKIIMIAFVVLVGAVMISIMIVPRRKAGAEVGLVPVFEEICYGRFMWGYGANIPIFRLSVYKDFFVIASFSLRVFRFSDLSRVEVRRGILRDNLFVELKKGGYWMLGLGSPERALLVIEAAQRRSSCSATTQQADA